MRLLTVCLLLQSLLMLAATSAVAALKAEYRFDEASWSGVPNEVVDIIGGANGTSVGTANTRIDGVVCRAGDFSDSTNVDRVNIPNTVVDGLTDFTVSAWGRTTSTQQQTIISGARSSGGNNEFLLFIPNSTTFRPYLFNGNGSITMPNIADGNWHHYVWVRSGTQNCSYIDGVLQGCVTLSAGAVDIANNGLVIAQEQDSVNGGYTSSQDWDGDLDELLIFDAAIDATEVADIYNNQLAGNNWDGSSRSCPGEATAPIAEFHFDESSWNGTSDEVIDNTGGGLDGTANGANIIDNGQICGAGTFDGSNDYIDINGLDTYLGTSSSLSFWIKTTQTGNDTSWRAPGIAGVEEAGGSDDVFWGWIDNSGDIGISAGNSGAAKSSAINDNTWRHIVLTRDAASGTVNVYVDGVLEQTFNSQAGDIGNSFSSIGRIEDTGGSPEYFAGDLDELLIFDQVISDVDVQIIYNNQSAGNNWDGSSRSCPGVVTPPIAEYRFDELLWDGTTDEVVETINNDNGTAEGVATTRSDGVVCRAGDFSNSTNVDRVNIPNTVVDGLTDFTVSTWGRTLSTQQQTIISGAESSGGNNEFLMFFPNSTTFRPFIFNGSSSINIPNISDGDWHHYVWVRSGTQNCFYVDGVLQGCVTLSPGAVNIANNGLVIAQEQDSVNGGYTSSQDWDGDLDELLIFDKAITAAEVTTIYNNQLSGNGWDGSARSCPGVVPAPVAEFRLDENSWDGSSDEVVDNTGGGLDGTANGAVTTNDGQVCGAGAFDGSNDYIDVNGLDTYLGATSSLSFWIKTTQTGNDTSWRAPGIAGVEQAGGSDDVFWGWIDSSGEIGISAGNSGAAKSPAINDNTWRHIVLTRDAASGTVSVYMNGVLEQTFNSQAGSIGNSFSSIGRIEDTGGSPEYFAGDLDEILIFDRILSATQVQTIYDNQSVGNNFDGSARPCPDVIPAPLAEYRFDEPQWDGTGNEVIDSALNGFDGNALETDNDVNTIVSGKVCRAGSFPDIADTDINHAVSTSIDIDSDVGEQGSISIWYRSDHNWGSDGQDRTLWDASSSGSDNKYFYLILRSDGSLRYGAEDSSDGDYRIDSASQSIAAGQWVNIVVTWDVNGIDQGDIWLDGAELVTSFSNNTMNAATLGNTYTLYIGDNRGSYFPGGSNRSANGDIDEVLVFDRVLTGPQITDMINKHNAGQNLDGSARVCPFSGPAYFEIEHDNAGIYCLLEDITVAAKDSADNNVVNYTGIITINSNSGIGNWSVKTGNGVLDNGANNDGVATYTYDASDNGVVVLSLDQSETVDTTPSSINISVVDGAVTDDDSEGNLNFAVSGFTITGQELTDPANPVNVANGQLAAKDFNLFIAAYGQTATDPICGVIEAYTGDKTLTFSNNYIEPVAGTIFPTINSTAISSPISVSFSSGQAVVDANYADAGRINITATEGSLVGATNNFVVKPAGICVEATTPNSECASANPNDDTCTAFVAAGADFTVQVSAKVWIDDSESNTDFCNNNNTPNFKLPINLTRELIAPAGGNGGVFSNNPMVIATNGTVEVGQSISEVGVFTLSTPELNYLGETIAVSTSANIGRFIPDHFKIDPAATPIVFSDGCGGTSANFHYLGQPLTACYDIQAMAFDGTTIVTNYSGAFNKLVIDSDDTSYGALDITESFSFNGARLNKVVGGTIVDWLDGEATVSADLTIERGITADGPFANTNIGVNVTDSDDVTTKNINLDTDLDTTDDHVDLGVLPGELRYGRAFFPPVYGPEIPVGDELPIPFVIQYWDGSDFVTNIDDSITAYDTWGLSCTPGSIGCVTLIPADPMAVVNNGNSNVASFIGIERPGINGNLTVEIGVDDWLKFDWNGDGLGDEDPRSVVTFGSYRGNDRIIYWRERSIQ